MEPAVEALLAERTDFVSMAKMQSMVRVTCLEIMNSAPEQVMEYRKEVIELKSMIQSYLLEVASLKEQMGASGSSTCGSFPPSSPSSASTCEADPPTPSDGAPVTLQASFMPPPESAWYEHKSLPRFAVQLRLPSGKLYPHADVTLRVSMLNGRGLPEEQKANGSGELLVGERNARAGLAGLAEWDNLRIAEPSSKHYGSFTMLIDVERAPPGVTIEQLQVGPITIQVGRMWSKRRKSEAELTGDDSISQIPGVGARYVSRLQLHGVSTIGQFAAMAATEVGKATLCKLCKGDNPRNSLNDQKLQSMIDTATGVVRGTVAYKKRSLGVVSGATTASARAVFGLGPAVDVPEPEFTMDELLLLASSDDSPSSPELEPLTAIAPDGSGGGGSGGGFNLGFGTFRGGGGGVEMDLGDDDDELIVRMRSAKLHSAPLDAVDHDVGGFAVLPPKAPPATGDARCAIQILPSKQKGGLSGFAAFDALEAAPPTKAATVPFAPSSPTLAALLRAAWHGDAQAIREAAAAAGSEAAGGVDRFGSTALHLAALNGRAEGVHALCGALDARALDAPATALGDATALHLAAVRGARAEAAADALLDAGATATVLMAGDVSAAHLAAWSGAPRLLERLLETAPGLLEAQTASGLSVLECAALGGHAECVAIAIAHGAWRSSSSRLPALHCAALGGDPEVLARVLASAVGASQLEALSETGWRPLHCAAASGNLHGLTALVSAGADVLSLTEDGLSALALACACGHADCATELLTLSPGLLSPATVLAGCPELVHALASGDPSCMQVLVSALARQGVDVASMLGMPVEEAFTRLHGAEAGAEAHELA